MAGIGDIFDFLSGRRRAKKKLQERLRKVGAEREAAVGAQRGKLGVSLEEQARRGGINLNTPLARYLYMGEVQNVSGSSNVKAFWYEIRTKSLHIQFLDNSTYGYGERLQNITPDIAMSLWRATSKGVWIWDRLRIRGTKLGHRVEYVMEVSPPGGRKYEQSAAAETAHEQQVQAESTFQHLQKFERLPGNRQNLGRHESGRGGKRARRNPATGRYELPS